MAAQSNPTASKVTAWLRRAWFRSWFWLGDQLFARRPRDPEPLGPWGERMARRHLLCQGYFVVGRNVRTRSGEIDLIAVDGRRLVFVEVKTLAASDLDQPADRVDRAKQEHLSKAATEYCRHRQLLDVPGRFDVVAIWANLDDSGRPSLRRLRHYANAFESTLD